MDLVPTETIEFNDLRLVVYAAVAFNMGLSVWSERTPEAKEELTTAIQRIATLVGLEYDGTHA